MMEATLLEAGMPAERITVIVDEQEAIDAALKLGQPGDLLVVFADNTTRSWKQIIYFKGEDGMRPLVSPSPTQVKVALPVRAEAIESQLGGTTVIADERGVRLARETDD